MQQTIHFLKRRFSTELKAQVFFPRSGVTMLLESVLECVYSNAEILQIVCVCVCVWGGRGEGGGGEGGSFRTGKV